MIDEDKCGTAKLAAEIGKFPDIPDANGASSGYKDETNAGGKRVHRIIAVVMLDTCFLYKEWNQRGFIGLIGVGGAA